ncbi:MAG: cobyric acid synthase [Actinobacteria bacterium]|nr:cobyric acid synthase [Actinomycetota bacterium]
MVQGTSSHVGKSITVAALGRILLQDGFKVCPFKSQNMALNSYITSSGGEMGRAQVVQAEACGLKPEVYMNPILIKPIVDSRAQIIYMGQVVKNMTALEYDRKKKFYLDEIKKIIAGLKKKFDFVIIEGAGSPAEINLLKNDIVNMSVAIAASSPVILVGDVDRGGVFASFYGTVKILPFTYRKYIKALLINKFRGDIRLLEPGNDYISRKLRLPVLGTIPYYRDIHIEEEDSVNLERERYKKNFLKSTNDNDVRGNLIIGIVYLPHISNFTDFNALELEPGVSLVYAGNREELSNLKPHIIIIPGSKSTISDLIYLRESGLESEIRKQNKNGAMVIGICGGYQMMGNMINDKYKSESEGHDSIKGMGLLDISTVFLKEKNTFQTSFEFCTKTLDRLQVLRERVERYASQDIQCGKMSGYEIHMGVSKAEGKKNNGLKPLFKITGRGGRQASLDEGFIMQGPGRQGLVLGTYIHGIFDNFIFRKAIIDLAASLNGLKVIKDGHRMLSYRDFREAQYDRLARLFRENMDMKSFYKILARGI